MAAYSKSLFVLTLLAAVGCGLAGGGFLVFSSFIMKALARLPAREGIAAMQSINVAVLNSMFLTVLMGTALACFLLMALSLIHRQTPGIGYRLAAGLLYLAGNIVVTGVCNVPLNDRLAAMNPSSPEAAGFWASYLVAWTNWNHVRTGTAFLAAVCFTLALVTMEKSVIANPAP